MSPNLTPMYLCNMGGRNSANMTPVHALIYYYFSTSAHGMTQVGRDAGILTLSLIMVTVTFVANAWV